MVPIYVKTVYSFLESLITIDDLIDFGKNHNLNYLCICDDNMYGTMEFIIKCQNNGIIPIIGLDLHFCLLFSKNYDGYLNLLKINNLKEEKEISFEDLSNYSSNLVCFKNEDSPYKLENIFHDIYIYSDSKKKNNYLKKILCLKKEDVSTLKYLYMLKENKTVSDDIVFLDDVYYEVNNNFDFFYKCSFALPDYTLKLPDYSLYNDTKKLNNLLVLQMQNM